MSDPIDFSGLAAALLPRAYTLVPLWLPGGHIRGKEYVCSDLSGGPGKSLSVNLETGVWKDFSGADGGGDLISLYAAIYGLNNGQAARQLMDELGLSRSSNSSIARSAPVQTSASAAAESPAEAPVKRKSLWRAVTPVPKHAPPPEFKHWHYTELAGSWEYKFEGDLYGYVVRYTTSDGGKEVLPHTWCVDESDGRGTMRWHFKQWDEPRPLYVPASILAGDPKAIPVVLVEGEKCALAGLKLLGHEFDFVSWPGGANAWAKANWGWLMGRTVYLWADCDAKRHRLTADERAAGVDPNTKPLLDESRQPGMAAMRGIGSMLVADFGCTVFLCPVPKPGAVSDGWDIADAIEQGWGPEDVRAFIRGAKPFIAPDDAARAKAEKIDHSAGADQDSLSVAWRSKLLLSSTGAIKAVRENAVLALDGLPTQGLPGVQDVAGVIAFNEFTNNVMKLKPAPWGTEKGEWDESDELFMGEWLTREHWLPSMPRGTLEEAVTMVAYRHKYHPVREELMRLKGTWDQTKRLSTWIRQVCMVDDEWDDNDPLHKYLSRVGTWLVMGMCQRILQPGCKFDYMVVFEGAQGVGKSTLAQILGGDYFADTGLVLGDKDSYQNLQGIWVYEWGELDALNKSEVTKVKAFTSSQKDRFRASFDKRAKNYPRQVVFIGTTNEDHYLTDPTGNRRIWPVRVTRQVDMEWLRANRSQMLAEAMVYLDAGERFHPTPTEQRALFEPQQNRRAVENAIESTIARYLYDEKQRVPQGAENGTLVNTITLVELLQRIGIGLEKLGPGRFHEKQAAAALRRLGWTERRSSDAGRPRVYDRPKTSQTGSTQSQQPEGADDDCPF